MIDPPRCGSSLGRTARLLYPSFRSPARSLVRLDAAAFADRTSDEGKERIGWVPAPTDGVSLLLAAACRLIVTVILKAGAATSCRRAVAKGSLPFCCLNGAANVCFAAGRNCHLSVASLRHGRFCCCSLSLSSRLLFSSRQTRARARSGAAAKNRKQQRGIGRATRKSRDGEARTLGHATPNEPSKYANKRIRASFTQRTPQKALLNAMLLL